MPKSREDKKLILMPYAGIPVVEAEIPSISTMREKLVEWAGDNRSKVAIAFLAHEGNGESIDDYCFQLGFVNDDRLVTTKKRIKQVAALVYSFTRLNYFGEANQLLRDHMSIYIEVIGSIPSWGESKFNKLVEEGKTIRTLEGPNKKGGLKVGENRQVVLDQDKEFAYGPMVD